MKPFLKFLVLLFAIPAVFITLGTFTAAFTTDAFDFKPYLGPFPLCPPAGHSIVTNGTKFKIVSRSSQWHSVFDSASEAIDFSWHYIESDRKEKQRRAEREPQGPWLPVADKICQTKT